jgi:UrcA family protein
VAPAETTTMLKILCTSIALVALSSAATASAEQASNWRGTPWVRGVSYADLDLSQPADRDVLMGRIRAASEELCRDRQTINARRRCVDRMVEDAIARTAEPVRLALQERRLAQR